MGYVRGYYRRDRKDSSTPPSDGPSPWALLLLAVLLAGAAFWALFAWLGEKKPDEAPAPVHLRRTR